MLDSASGVQTAMPPAAISSDLPDACDMASPLVGYDINKAVFGPLDEGDCFDKSKDVKTEHDEAANTSNSDKADKKSHSFLGFLGLVALGVGAFAGFKKAKGQPLKLPAFDSVKDTVHNFLNKFKKTAPTP